MHSYYTLLPSPVGALLLTSDGQALTGLYTPGNSHYNVMRHGDNDVAPFKEAITQLEEYFSGERVEFSLPLALSGTPFQQLVWQALTRIPYGQTVCYRDIARQIGKPDAMRAVGSANGKNPVAIIVPCHRVVAASGALGGYNGGLETKQWLLTREAGALAQQASLKHAA